MIMNIVFIVLAIIVLGFLGIRYFLFRIGDPVNSKVSDSYFYHYRKNLIVYSPMGNWFELGYFESDADVESFQPLDRDFGKDKNNVFWKGRKQSVDYASFQIVASVIKDKNHVYHTNGKEYNFLEIVKDADPKTYQLLDSKLPEYKRLDWFKDANAVYYKSKKIKGDPVTFQPLNDAIAVDADYIYSIVNERGEGLYLTEVDEVIQKHKRIEGRIHVINDTYVQIENAIVSAFTKDEFTLHTFDSIKTTKEIDYFTIVVNDTLIYKGVLYPEIDIETLESLDYNYSKDKKNVYYNYNLMIGANPKTFKKTSENDVWEDGKNKYRNGKIIN